MFPNMGVSTDLLIFSLEIKNLILKVHIPLKPLFFVPAIWVNLDSVVYLAFFKGTVAPDFQGPFLVCMDRTWLE